MVKIHTDVKLGNDKEYNFQDFRSPGVLRFGNGAISSIKEEIEKLKVKKVCIISDKGLERVGLVQKVINLLDPIGITITTFTELEGEPSFQLVEQASKMVKEKQCDLVIGIGGGSALDVAKVAAALGDKEELIPYLSGAQTIEGRNIHCILLPTTSGTGSEVTMNAIFGDKEQGVKRGIVSPALLPDIAIIDPELTISCPPTVTAASGIDAFTHALESYISVNATPLTKIYAEKAMKLFPIYITKAVHNGVDIEARSGMSWVSVLAGVTLANAGVGAVHALAYPLGGTYSIEHGVANALLMPFVFKVIGKTCVNEMVNVASFLQLGDFSSNRYQALDTVVDYLFGLLEELNLPTSLKELDVTEESLPLLAEQASKVNRLLANTPYRLSQEKILAIYKNAYNGNVGEFES
ncbi:iron-containing alcohol dehydrogenase [Sporosarcina sp. 6E9]|uniref:iron-containing alcohol dehydrogenase n=1 Tax=Sporosarcina sp. 6E9 TaxID=2819235 RepID=UPI001B31533F|nr:iron-containing alcohol dehydrogenase [Sporosarcina sp. 6E9]